MSGMTTVDPHPRHVWVRTTGDIRCAYMICNAQPTPAEVARLDAEESAAAGDADGDSLHALRTAALDCEK